MIDRICQNRCSIHTETSWVVHNQSFEYTSKPLRDELYPGAGIAEAEDLCHLGGQGNVLGILLGEGHGFKLEKAGLQRCG